MFPWVLVGGGMLLALATWWAKQHLLEANGPAVAADPLWPVDVSLTPGVNLGLVEVTCQWCMKAAMQAAREDLFQADRDPVRCRSCGRPVWFVSQPDGDGRFFIC